MTPRRWPLIAGPLTVLFSVAGLWWSAGRAERAIRDQSDARLARHAVAFLRVVTPPTAKGYDAPRLLAGVNSLASASFWRGGFQLVLGRTPLLPDTMGLLPVPESLLERLAAGAPTVLLDRHRSRASLVPVLDPDQSELLGWAAAWGTLAGRLPSVDGALVTLLVLGGIVASGLAFWREHTARWRLVAFVGVLGLVVTLAADLGWSVYRTARDATDTRLLTLRRLVEIAATANGVRHEALSGIGVGATAAVLNTPVTLPDDVTREEQDGVLVAWIAAATPRNQGGLRFTLRPVEAGLGGLWLRLAAWVLLGALALGFTGWAGRAMLDPRHFRESLTGWAFVAPALGHLLVFSMGPALFTAYLSLHRWDLVSPARPFVGMENFRTIFADGRFLHSLGVSALFTLQVPVSLALSLLAAVLLDRSGIRVGALRTVLLLPFVGSVVAIALVWQWLFQPDAGLINQLLARAGIPGPDWLGDRRTALPALMLLMVWVQVGYQMTVFLGALQAVPMTYYEAARLEGAGAARRFWWITLPLLRPTVLFVLVTAVVNSFQVFTYVAVMTGGGPLQSTEVVLYRIYQEAWEFLRFGTASAMSLVLLALLLVLTWLQFRWLGRRVASP